MEAPWLHDYTTVSKLSHGQFYLQEPNFNVQIFNHKVVFTTANVASFFICILSVDTSYQEGSHLIINCYFSYTYYIHTHLRSKGYLESLYKYDLSQHFVKFVIHVVWVIKQKLLMYVYRGKEVGGLWNSRSELCMDDNTGDFDPA